MRLTPFPHPQSELWLAEHDLFTAGLHFPGRMTVARLPSGGLWLCSPIPIDDRLAAELSALGKVEALVAPNTFHHLHLKSAGERYPGARLLGAPGLPDKREDLDFDETLDDAPPDAWGGVFEQVVLRDIPSLNEVVFFHRPSRTVIATDLVMNVHHARGPLSRLVFWAEGCWRRPRVPRILPWFTKDREGMRTRAARIAAWPARSLVMAHGEPLADAEGFLAGELTRAFGELPDLRAQPAA